MAFPLFAPRAAASPNPNATLTSAGSALGGAGSGAGVSSSPPPPNTRIDPRLREVSALLLWTGAVFITLALASYEYDPAANNGQGLSTGADWVGPVGEACARAVVSLFGIAAWAMPLEAVLLGVPLVRGKKSTMTAARGAGDLLILLIASALVQVGWPGRVAFGHHAASGAVGELFGELARSLFSTVGSFLVGFALLGLILIARAAFSFIALLRWIAAFGEKGAKGTAAGAKSVAEAWRTAREIERERREQERLASMPHIETAPPDAATIAVLPPDEDPVFEALSDPVPASDPEPALDKEKKPARARKPRDPKDAKDLKDTRDALEPADANGAKDAKDAKDPKDAKDAKALRRRGAEAPELEARSAAPAADGALASAGSDDEITDDPPMEIIRPDVPIGAPEKKARAPKKPDGPTIVDTSAALAPDKPLDKPAGAAGGGAGAGATAAGADKRRVVQLPLPPPSFKLPGVEMLVPARPDAALVVDKETLFKNAELLVKTLADYGVSGKVEDILPGPTVTTFEVSPAAGTKVSKVASLADDLALALARKVRIVAPIPGKNRIGFELPNERRIPVNLRDLIEDRRFQSLDAPLPVVLGRDILGAPVYADLASMPHVIVAGATGAGKSVGLNVMLTSLLYRRTPEELRLLMIDPKVVELAPFDRIPHMLLPVVTDMKQAANALKWAVDEMERRYQLFADAGTKNIGTYNAWCERVARGEAKNPLARVVVSKDHNGLPEEIPAGKDEEGIQPLPEKLPLIVIVVDEFADLMMQQGKDVEAAVARLAQKARAAGMHVILATQRPSVDVITGMIKANFPTRIAYRVAQKVDSRTILDEQGAEHLLGRGDMLIKLNGTNETKRVQCPMVSEEEVQAVTDHLRKQGEPVYDENILKPREEDGQPAEEEDAEQDAMYDDAVRLVADTRRCSTSWLQRKLGLGYNRAARIVEMMERRGLVGPANGAKDREVLIDPI